MINYQENPVCIKCGSSSILTEYKKYTMNRECLERTCKNCGYLWSEHTKDTEIEVNIDAKV